MRNNRSIADDFFDISLWFLFLVAACIFAVSLNPNPARADETTGPFMPVAMICVSGPLANGCQERSAAPVATLAECNAMTDMLTNGIKDGALVPDQIKNHHVKTKYVWQTGCLSPDGKVHLSTEHEIEHGGQKI